MRKYYDNERIVDWQKKVLGIEQEEKYWSDEKITDWQKKVLGFQKEPKKVSFSDVLLKRIFIEILKLDKNESDVDEIDELLEKIDKSNRKTFFNDNKYNFRGEILSVMDLFFSYTNQNIGVMKSLTNRGFFEVDDFVKEAKKRGNFDEFLNKIETPTSDINGDNASVDSLQEKKDLESWV